MNRLKDEQDTRENIATDIIKGVLREKELLQHKITVQYFVLKATNENITRIKRRKMVQTWDYFGKRRNVWRIL